MANIRVATERLTDVIVVPQDVVLRTEDGYQVFVVVENPEGPVAEARSVDLGPSFENEVVVVAGLETGDRLIVKGHQMVDAGDRVREVGEGGGR
jgi:membrane fusion protein (multidrug efflux system)